MLAAIPSAQLEAITRLELAAIALQKAHVALQHPDLHLDGLTVLAPSGRKHIEQITRLSLRIGEATMTRSQQDSPVPRAGKRTGAIQR
ncbi:MAG: hypothetical protein ABS61_05565 [Microbacterium sp. SCN 70-18]|nr:hypothetical protein [Microbacterium chocolatum]ODT11049.1 MAG: hypothetical protein ABS61_05565 [Microbacterium sp. SCN 70-18]